MAGVTYLALGTTTLASSAGIITFGSIPSSYRDLVLILNPTGLSATSVRMRFNGDSGYNYPAVRLYQDGTPKSDNQNNDHADIGFFQTNSTGLLVVNIFEYGIAKHKTAITRWNNVTPSNGHSGLNANVWANTLAITSIVLSPSSGSFGIGTTASLFGIGA